MPLGGDGGSFNTHGGGHGRACGSTSDGGDGGDGVKHGGGGHQGRSCGSGPVGGDGGSLNTHGGGHGRTIIGPPEGGDGGSFQMHGGGQVGTCPVLSPLFFSIGQGHGTQERIAGAIAGGVAAEPPFGGTGQMGEEQAMPSRGSRSQREVSPIEHTSAGVFSGHEGTDGPTVAQGLVSWHESSGLTVGPAHAAKALSQELRAILVAVGAALWLAPAPAVAA